MLSQERIPGSSGLYIQYMPLTDSHRQKNDQFPMAHGLSFLCMSKTIWGPKTNGKLWGWSWWDTHTHDREVAMGAETAWHTHPALLMPQCPCANRCSTSLQPPSLCQGFIPFTKINSQHFPHSDLATQDSSSTNSNKMCPLVSEVCLSFKLWKWEAAAADGCINITVHRA